LPNVITCQELKAELDKRDTEGLGHYKVTDYAPKISDAIQNAKASDKNPDRSFPGPLQTKVYKLAESLLAVLNK
jgi:hypothetical protein